MSFLVTFFAKRGYNCLVVNVISCSFGFQGELDGKWIKINIILFKNLLLKEITYIVWVVFRDIKGASYLWYTSRARIQPLRCTKATGNYFLWFLLNVHINVFYLTLILLTLTKLEEELGGLSNDSKLKPKRIRENKEHIYKVTCSVFLHLS